MHRRDDMWRILLVALLMAGSVPLAAVVERPVQAATCVSSVGPGVPPPATLTSGIPGFHASWYGQSGYPTLCPGDRSTATVAYYNSGSNGWIRGKMGEAAYLGTWGPEPGQDKLSPLGGDGTSGSPSTGWPRYNRIATQPAEWVGPNQVAWFTFTIQAPTKPGFYRLYLRPLIEGTTWMEDFGVYWPVTVLNPDGTYPPPPAQAGCREWPAALGEMLAKLPVSPELCLLPIEPRLELCPAPLAGCYLGKGNYLTGVSWPRNTVWVSNDSSILLAHETCHAHQHRVTLDAGYPGVFSGWVNSIEAADFKTAWATFKSQYPQAYPSWRETDQTWEIAADVCAGWYFASGVVNTSAYPPLAEWARKYLPR